MDPADKTDLETFSETFGGGSTSDPLEDSSPTGIEDDECEICSKKYTAPRVLSCLHVFCEGCLDGLLSEATGEEAKGDTITCPKCSQDTKVGIKGASCLPLDYVLTNILDMSAIESMTVLCTSCKANEKAVARCSDCANFLCPNCNTAHQFMRCFENHHVVAFEDLKKSHEAVPIHKPIFCEAHPAESMKFYCFSCQVVTCNDCLLGEHKGPEHRYERLAEAEPRQREELHALMSESRSKVTFCEDASELLDNALTELQAQRDAAHDLIGETFHSYRAILEHNRDQLLKQLQESHTRRELHIMDTFHSVEKTMEKIEDACKFTSRLLEHGNTAEVLSLKRVVGAQLLHLINNTPKPDVSTAIHFDTDLDKFEAAVKATFGSLRAELASTPKETSPPPLLNGGGPMVPPAAGSSTVTSSPVSMQSSLEGELGPVAAAFSLPPPPVVATVPPPPPPLRGLTSIQEYNLQQLANLAEKEGVAGGPAPTPPGDSPTPGFTLADLFSGDLSSTSNAINNLQALAKLGSVSLNNQGQIVVNGATSVGLVDPLSPPGNPTGHRTTPPTPSPAGPAIPPTLGALLNDLVNGGAAANAVLARGSSPALEINTTMATLNGGAFHSLSGTPSPILSQKDDLLEDPHLGPSGGFTPGRNKQAPMQVRSKFGQLGPSKSQFNSPHGFCLGSEEDIIVADTNNHRIQVFEKTSVFKFQFGTPGKEEGQLWYPRKVAVMRNSGKFVVCDRGNERSRMQIFTKNGHFIKKIAIRYIDIVAGLAVTSVGQIVAVDSVSPTVFVISENGSLIRWFDCSEFMREPSDIAISGREYFVCDFKGHCVVVFSEEGQFLRRIGCENITNFPNGIDISDAGDVLVGDSHGNRFHVAVFTRDGNLLSEFECPYVKVSRCCGLKITSEGYVVTLAKNNHHVLILNTLYIM